jgi:uncharacterized protein
MTISHGHFAWHELGTTDVDAAATFYPQVTPWTTQPMEGMDDYTLWMNGEEPVGGLMSSRGGAGAQGASAQWIPYVHIYDVDETVRTVKSSGGTVLVPPREVPSVGCWAVLADPQCAAIGVYEPADNAPAPYKAAKVGEFSWHELITTDYQAAFEFYRKLFRWETTGQHDMGSMGTYHMFGQKGAAYGGMFNAPDASSSPMWVSYVRIPDVRAAATKIADAGGAVVVEPHEVPGGDWIVRCRDAQGATFALQSSKAS